MKKSTTISKLILLVLFLMHNLILAQNQTITVNGSQIQVSSTLQTVLNQAETIYVKPIFEISLSTFLNKAPNFAPLFVGLIMHRQEIMMREIITSEQLNNLSALEEEIYIFLEQLAEAHNDSNPFNNEFMPAAMLKVSYQDALKGNSNAICKNDFGIDPTTVEIEYLLDRSPNLNNVADNTNDEHMKAIPRDNSVDHTVHYKLQVKDEDKNEINFLGEVAGYAMAGPEVKQFQDASGNTKVEGLVCPEKNKSPTTYFFDIDTNNIPNDGTDVRCVYFGKDGPLREQAPYVNNKKHGVFINYIMDGDIRYLIDKFSYVNGKKHGVHEHYSIDSGKHYLSVLTTFANDKKEGVQKIWLNSRKGLIYMSIKTYYSNDKKNGKEESYFISSSTGQPYIQYLTTYANGEKNGEYIGYKETGKVLLKGNYRDGKKHGQWTSYSIYRAVGQTQISHCITDYNNGVEISEKCWGPKGNIVWR